MSVRIVLVDDHLILREGLRLLLQREPDFKGVGQAATAAEALPLVAQTRPDVHWAPHHVTHPPE